MSENHSTTSDPPASKEGHMALSGNKSRSSVNSSPPDGDVVFDMDDPEEEEESDALDTAEPRESAPSPAEPCDENAPKRCVYDGCSETSALGAKQRKPWMCKKHRNKMYKDKYKKKKSDQAMASGKLDVSMLLSFLPHDSSALRALLLLVSSVPYYTKWPTLAKIIHQKKCYCFILVIMAL